MKFTAFYTKKFAKYTVYPELFSRKASIGYGKK
jgi:hypothetical protein